MISFTDPLDLVMLDRFDLVVVVVNLTRLHKPCLNIDIETQGKSFCYCREVS